MLFECHWIRLFACLLLCVCSVSLLRYIEYTWVLSVLYRYVYLLCTICLILFLNHIYTSIHVYMNVLYIYINRMEYHINLIYSRWFALVIQNEKKSSVSVCECMSDVRVCFDLKLPFNWIRFLSSLFFLVKHDWSFHWSVLLFFVSISRCFYLLFGDRFLLFLILTTQWLNSEQPKNMTKWQRRVVRSMQKIRDSFWFGCFALKWKVKILFIRFIMCFVFILPFVVHIWLRLSPSHFYVCLYV